MLGNSNNNKVCLLKRLRTVHGNVVIKSLCTNINSSVTDIEYRPCVVPVVRRVVGECSCYASFPLRHNPRSNQCESNKDLYRPTPDRSLYVVIT